MFSLHCPNQPKAGLLSSFRGFSSNCSLFPKTALSKTKVTSLHLVKLNTFSKHSAIVLLLYMNTSIWSSCRQSNLSSFLPSIILLPYNYFWSDTSIYYFTLCSPLLRSGKHSGYCTLSQSQIKVQHALHDGCSVRTSKWANVHVASITHHIIVHINVKICQ